MGIARNIYQILNRLGLLNLLSDQTYTRLKYRLKMGRRLNLKKPETFTEKLNWLKLYDHDPRCIPLVDKWEVTRFVRERIGESYCVPKYGVWDRFEDIPFDDLPNQCTQLKSPYPEGPFGGDIHCLCSPDRRYILVDGYPDDEGYRPLFL